MTPPRPHIWLSALRGPCLRSLWPRPARPPDTTQAAPPSRTCSRIILLSSCRWLCGFLWFVWPGSLSGTKYGVFCMNVSHTVKDT